jgi:glycosyltransferase involved in cell wall biosynthesis
MSSSNCALFLSGVRGDTRRYRIFHPYEQLRLAGVRCGLAHITDRDLPAKMAQASLVVFHRVRFDPHIGRLFQSLEARDGLAVLDVDDLVFDTQAFSWIDSPDFKDSIRAGLYLEDMRRSRMTLEKCRAVTASTDFLAGLVREGGKPAWVHRNAFSLEMLELSEAAARSRPIRTGRLTIGYASGTPTHNRDFELIKPALRQVLQRYAHTELLLLGPLDPGTDWGPLGERVRTHKLVPWRQLPALLAQFDINLAPLVSGNPFSQSKSEIKYMEAGLVKTPTIATPTDAFAYAIQNGENGMLASGEREWVEGLCRLVEDGALRRRMAENAYADIQERYHPRVRSAELVNTLNEIHAQFRSEPFFAAPVPGSVQAASFRLDPALEANPSSIKMGLYDLRHRGVGTLLKRVWVFFRRLAAPVFPFK